MAWLYEVVWPGAADPFKGEFIFKHNPAIAENQKINLHDYMRWVENGLAHLPS